MVFKMIDVKIAAQETADNGDLRIGDAEISFATPDLGTPDVVTADNGDLRIGDAEIAGSY